MIVLVNKDELERLRAIAALAAGLMEADPVDPDEYTAGRGHCRFCDAEAFENEGYAAYRGRIEEFFTPFRNAWRERTQEEKEREGRRPRNPIGPVEPPPPGPWMVVPRHESGCPWKAYQALKKEQK